MENFEANLENGNLSHIIGDKRNYAELNYYAMMMVGANKVDSIEEKII